MMKRYLGKGVGMAASRGKNTEEGWERVERDEAR